MYSVAGYGRMLSDQVRTRAYADALAAAMTPDCTVLDIGTGTGFFALLACRLGARKVYAIEPDEVIQLARIAARDNGYADRITFFQDLSTCVDLPERVDVIVSDLRTVLPWFQQHIPAIADARTRLLKPGGILIPQHDRLWATVIETASEYADHVGHQPENTAGFDMSAARAFGTTAWAKIYAAPDQFLAPPTQCAELDYRSVTDTNLRAQASWTAERAGTGHGFAAWFDTVLFADIGYSNAPGRERLVYGNAFFPWQQPVAIAADDRIDMLLRADLVDDDYFWRWDTVVTRGGREIARFAQSNLSAIRAFQAIGRRDRSGE